MSPLPAPKVRDFHYQRRVEFADTDMGGILHFSRYFVFAEEAEHAFLRSLGTSVEFEVDGQRAGWPRLASSADFKAPARFEDVLDVHLRIRRKGRTSMTYAWEIHCDGRLLARGHTAAACCLMGLPEGLKTVPIPASIADRLEEDPGA